MNEVPDGARFILLADTQRTLIKEAMYGILDHKYTTPHGRNMAKSVIVAMDVPLDVATLETYERFLREQISRGYKDFSVEVVGGDIRNPSGTGSS